MLVIAKTQKKHIKQILKKGIIFIGTKLNQRPVGCTNSLKSKMWWPFLISKVQVGTYNRIFYVHSLCFICFFPEKCPKQRTSSRT